MKERLIVENEVEMSDEMLDEMLRELELKHEYNRFSELGLKVH